MVKILEVVIYFKNNKRQRIIPDVHPVMKMEDMLIWKSIMIRAMRPFVEEEKEIKVFMIYQNLVNYEKKEMEPEETL